MSGDVKERIGKIARVVLVAHYRDCDWPLIAAVFTLLLENPFATLALQEGQNKASSSGDPLRRAAQVKSRTLNFIVSSRFQNSFLRLTSVYMTSENRLWASLPSLSCR